MILLAFIVGIILGAFATFAILCLFLSNAKNEIEP